MEIQTTMNDGKAVMVLNGRFDFNAHRVFKDAYAPLLKEGALNTIEIDLSRVQYLDSSALGMLLMLRERATAVNKQIVLSRANGTITQILEIANFGKLFTIS
ncbi:MAG: STAS domain-containing protein [Pseudomonadota bacterium]